MYFIFTLETFNSRLSNVELGPMEVKDKPTPITDTTLLSSGHKLKQSGIIIRHTLLYSKL